jgi:MYXO-CTERM domain-containing protein
MLACSCWLYPAGIVVVALLILGGFFVWRGRRRRDATSYGDAD